MGLIPDNLNSLEEAFKKAAEIADLTITSGGVSVGEADYTKMVVKKLGDVAFLEDINETRKTNGFWKIWTDKKRNGKDFSPIWSSGNPVAVMVTFYVFVRDAIFEMMGSSEAKSNLLYIASSEKIKKKKPGEEQNTEEVKLIIVMVCVQKLVLLDLRVQVY